MPEYYMMQSPKSQLTSHFVADIEASPKAVPVNKKSPGPADYSKDTLYKYEEAAPKASLASRMKPIDHQAHLPIMKYEVESINAIECGLSPKFSLKGRPNLLVRYETTPGPACCLPEYRCTKTCKYTNKRYSPLYGKQIPLNEPGPGKYDHPERQQCKSQATMGIRYGARVGTF